MKEEINEQGQPAMVKCDWCGKEFPADPRAFSEAGISMWEQPDESEEWKGEGEQRIQGFDIATLPDDEVAEMMKEMELSREQLAELLKTGHLDTGYSCVCLECQDSAISDDP